MRTCPNGTWVQLRAAGHEVLYVVERTRRLDDSIIIQDALDAEAIILTQDKDYWRNIIIEKRPSLGAVWIRLAKMPRLLRTARLMTAFETYQSHLLHHFTIIHPDRIEQQSLPPVGP